MRKRQSCRGRGPERRSLERERLHSTKSHLQEQRWSAVITSERMHSSDECEGIQRVSSCEAILMQVL